MKLHSPPATSFLYFLPVAPFPLQQWSCTVASQTRWPWKPKIFPLWPFTKEVSCASFAQSKATHTHTIKQHNIAFSSVQSLSCVPLFAIPWITAHQASLSITNSWSPPKLMSIESVMPSSHLILCCPLLLLPSIFPSIRVFSNESALHIRWPKYWSFSFNISPSSEHSGLISFRMDWLDLLADQGTLKSLLQYQVQKHQFFSVQLCL